MPRTKFKGYRVSIRRAGSKFERYISDKKQGSKDEAEELAYKLRDLILESVGKAVDKKAELEKYANLATEDIISQK